MLGDFTSAGKSNYFAQSRRRAVIWTVLLAAVAFWTGAAHADTVTAVGDDNNVSNPTSFNSAGSLAINNTTGQNATPVWSNGLAPAPGNDYVVQYNLMRTPAAGGNITFQGDSLAFIDGGQFRTKNTTAAGDTLTINKLIIDGGNIAINGNAPATIAGNIQVGLNGMTVYSRAVTNNFGTITSNISDVPGSPGGVVAIGGGALGGSINMLNTLTPAITNSYTGQTYLMGGNVQLGNANALPSSTTLVFGSAGSPVNNSSNAGAATLDLNGLSTVTVAGLAVQSYTASGPVSLFSGGQPTSSTPAGLAILPQVEFTVRVNPIPVGTVKIGQAADGVGTANPTRVGVVGVYNTPTYTDIILESNTGGTTLNNTTAGLTGLSFEGTSPNPARQVIGNGKSNSDAILIITGPSTFAGTIQNAVVANPNGGALATNATTGISFGPTAAGSTLTLSGANTYTGTTTVVGINPTLVLNYTGTTDSGNMILTGFNATLALNTPNNVNYTGVISGTTGNLTKGSIGTLTLSNANTYGGATTINGGGVTLDFSAAGAPTSNILYNSVSPGSLTLSAATLTLKGGSTAANSQQFNGMTLAAGGSSIVLSANATAQPLALNVGSITRSLGGTLVLTNPGTPSATNGLLTTSGSAGALLTSNGVPYVVVGNDWGAKDATNSFVTALSSYTASTATTLSGNANVVTDVNLASGGSAGSIRFNDSTPRTVTVASGSLSAGGILMTSLAGNATITGGSLQAVGVGGELVLVQNHPTNVLTISSNIVDNGTSGLTTAGVGKTVLSGQNTYAGKTLIGSGTVQFTKAQALYNNSPASWTANNISVSSGATFGLNVGGPGEFTGANVATLAALGTATGGLRNGANLALDTTNAAGGVFALTSPIVNTNGGANAIGLTKNGTGTLQLAAGANSYTSLTTINKGTLQLTGANSLAGNTAVTLNDATAKLDLNGFDTSLGGLSSTVAGSTVALGAGNLTLNSTSNATYAGSFTGTGGINFNLGVFGTNTTTQTLTGPGYTGGALNLANGTVTLSPTSATTWGSPTTTHYVASLNSGSAVLNVGANATLAADNLVIAGNLYTSRDTTAGGTGALNVTAATSKVTANTLNLGMSNLPFDSISQNPPPGVLPPTFQAPSPTATATLSNGTIELAGTSFANGYTFTPAYSAATGASPAPVTLIDGPANIAMIMAPDNNETATMTISGGSLKLDNNSLLVFGKNGNRTATITQSGGTVTFYSDAGNTVGGTGGIYFVNQSNTSGSSGVYTYNLNGGTLTVPQILNNGPGGTSAGILVLNGGTLKPTADTSAFITTGPHNGASNNTPQVRVGANAGNGGAIIDTNGKNITLGSPLLHNPGLAAGVTDDGLKKQGLGTLTLDKTSTYTGTTNILAGVLQPAIQTAISGTATVNGGATLINVGPSGTYDSSLVQNLNNLQTLSGTGHVTGFFTHTTLSSVITGGGVGTAGTLTFDNSLDLAGGQLRADLDQTATTYDKITVSQNGGFGASGSPSASLVDVEFIGGTLPTAPTKYSIVNYSGNFNGPTDNQTFAGQPVANPTNLIMTSSNAAVVGRNTQLAVNNTTHTLDVIFQPGAVAGNLIWTGGTAHTSSVWDTNTTSNWNNLTPPTNPDKFFTRDAVTFDNSAGVPHAITISGVVAPASFTVNSDGAANSFSFAGTGKISGNGTLTKSGTSTLTIATSNDYTGATTINAGTVVALDSNSAAGSTSALGVGPLTIASGAVLQVGNGTSGSGSIASASITNNGSVIVNRQDSSTINAAITGTGTLAIQGGGTVSLKTRGVTNASTYTGNTTISGGSTLQLGEASATSVNSVINVDNSPGSRFTLNGFDTVIGGLSGGGANSGDVTINANNFTIAGLGTNNLTYSGPISSNGGTLFIGRVTPLTTGSATTTPNVNDEGDPGNNNTVTARVVAATSKDAVQTLSGSGIILNGPITVRVGTLNLAPTTPTIIGGTNRAIAITAPITLPFGFAAGSVNPPGTTTLYPDPANLTTATMTINSNTTLQSSTLTLNPGQNSLSTFIQNGGTVQAAGIVAMGGSAGGSTMTLNGGTFLAAAAPANSPGTGASASFQMAPNPGQNNFTPTRPYQFATLNVNTGATLSIVNQLSMGGAFNSPCTINQNGGTVQFVDGTSFAPGGTGGWVCINNNATNFGQSVWNLNGGLLAMNNAQLLITAGVASAVPNIRPVMNFNGGTLQALSDQPTAMFDSRYNLVAKAKGGTIDTNNHTINLPAPILHDTTLGSAPDGGMTIVDSVGGGNLTYSAVNTYTGPTKIGAGTSLTLGVAGAIQGSSKIDLVGGTLLTGGLDQDMSATTNLKISANSILDLGNNGAVRFADSTLSHWATGRKLTINNSSAGHILVGTTSTSLNPNQLSQVQFSGSPAGGVLTSFGELRAGTGGGTIEKLGDVDHNGTTNTADITAMLTALTNLNTYTNNLTLDSGWTSKASEALYLADVNFDDQINNLDLQALLTYLKSGGNGSNAPGGGSVAPVPEPASFALLALGAAMGIGLRFSQLKQRKGMK
jgi:fibronectin-binding autotransporter adhesin